MQQQQRVEQAKQQQQGESSAARNRACARSEQHPSLFAKSAKQGPNIAKNKRGVGTNGAAASETGFGNMALVPGDLQPTSHEAQTAQEQGDSVASGGRLVVPKLALNDLPHSGTAARPRNRPKRFPR